MLHTLDEFTVSTEYGRNRTAFTVRERGRSAPVAVAGKDTNVDSRGVLEVRVGAELAGYVQVTRAWTAERVAVGAVETEHRFLRPDRWVFRQNGLAPLVGGPSGASVLRENFPLDMVLDHRFADLFLARRLRFRSPESAGFELVRRAGFRDRYRVRIHDRRIDRLLVLSCVVHLARFGSSPDLRKDFVELTSNPFRNL